MQVILVRVERMKPVAGNDPLNRKVSVSMVRLGWSARLQNISVCAHATSYKIKFNVTNPMKIINLRESVVGGFCLVANFRPAVGSKTGQPIYQDNNKKPSKDYFTCSRTKY